VHAYRLRPIVHPLQLRFQLLREQREVCQILLLSWQAILRPKSDTAEQSWKDEQDNSLCGSGTRGKKEESDERRSFAIVRLGFAYPRVVIQHRSETGSDTRLCDGELRAPEEQRLFQDAVRGVMPHICAIRLIESLIRVTVWHDRSEFSCVSLSERNHFEYCFLGVLSIQ
jgi:hypothetical protein